MSNPVPKEQLSAYQRWELSSFDAPAGQNTVSTKETVVLPSQETINLIKEDARRHGFEIGLEEGRLQGMADSKSAIAVEVQRLRELLSNSELAVADLETLLANSILELATDMTKAMLKTSLNIKPELIIPLIRSTLREIQILQKPAQLFLNPDDFSIVQAAIGEELLREGWLLRDEPSISRGGCRVETGSNVIDATVETRWSRIASSLGMEQGWFDE